VTVARVVVGFASPLGINKLLEFLEARARGLPEAAQGVRPAVWVAWLFLGPAVGSVLMQVYIVLNTRTLVRTEALLTQLVFAHALRVRMKAGTGTDGGAGAGAESPAAPAAVAGVAAQAAPAGPSLAGVAEMTAEGSVDAESDAETLRASEAGASTAGASTPGSPTSEAGSSSGAKKGGKGKKSGKDDDDADADGGSLVGKINNLVTTDLGNITDGRDFLLLVVWAPLELALSMWFLYYFLGWSSLVGLAVMVALLPVPGYLAKKIQALQVEGMKKVRGRLAPTPRPRNAHARPADGRAGHGDHRDAERAAHGQAVRLGAEHERARGQGARGRARAHPPPEAGRAPEQQHQVRAGRATPLRGADARPATSSRSRT
jgi:hypothetical protein